jgi:hypothetical protein
MRERSSRSSDSRSFAAITLPPANHASRWFPVRVRHVAGIPMPQ